MTSSRSLWTIVLAGGEGTRLHPLTGLLHGEELPKQFAMIHRGQSLLQETLARTAGFCPPARTVVVVAADREGIARSQLSEYPSIQIVVQPLNLGTGPGVLLPLAHVMARDPDAVVAIVPSDHFVKDAGPFIQTVRVAADEALCERALVLVGAMPDRAEIEYGWILPKGGKSGQSSSVSGFHEKPTHSLAEQLLRAGALWNTFVMVATTEHFSELAREHLLEHSRRFDVYREALLTDSASQVLSSVYAEMSPADFSRDVLEHAESLRVVPLSPCGWSDWGTPGRVLGSLRGSGEFSALLERIRTLTGSEPEALVPEFVQA